MIPTRHDYYRRRAREHRKLALAAGQSEQRAMHDQLVRAYDALAKQYRLRQIVRLKI
ncbi:hypothetical protein SLG_31760 [Sphingobium sp. SYK-6]|uniref:hypothetical protein n=1 Tax=Sphingobium sp. (strain NBRC 103272 / SYK-6) TaxID=627192 RepID=UPI0002277633|nr:hypothetical protein [Sphingobium sp. SYK-6]BAK67851.1 hypothetical protein SLG_31760 [Sphingobium sp. SYK-6]